jgi:hypothetical protein
MSIKTYKTTNLPVVLYMYETWSLTAIQEYRLNVFLNSILRRLFGFERDEIIGG